MIFHPVGRGPCELPGSRGGLQHQVRDGLSHLCAIISLHLPQKRATDEFKLRSCPCDGAGKDKATRGAVCIPPCTSRAHHLSPAQARSPARAICPTICPEKCWLEGQTDLPSCCCTRGFWINALALINQEYQDLSLNSLSSNRIRLLWFDADLDPYQLSGFLHLYFLDEAWWTKKPG